MNLSFPTLLDRSIRFTGVFIAYPNYRTRHSSSFPSLTLLVGFELILT
jgi:hypothetical protein